MHTLWRVIVKELLQLRQDRRMIPIVFFAPVVQLVVFGLAVNTDVQDVPLLLVDQDRSAASRELREDFVRSGYFELAGEEQDLRAVDRWLLTGDAQLALLIGAGYGQALASSRPAPVQVIADGSDASSATVALGYASRIVAARGAQVVAARLQAQGRALPAGQIELVPRVWYNPELQSRRFYVPAVLALVLMVMTMLLSAMGVVREKEIGTMEQIMVTPIRPWQLLVGKLFPFAAIGSIQVFLVTAATVWGFGVPLRGSFLLLFFLTQLFILNTLGLGLLVSTVVRTQQQAMMGAAFFVMVPMIYLSGLIFPIENMPRAVQLVTYVVPVRYYANVIRGIFLRGSGIDVLWPEALTLLLMGLAILGLASLRFRKRLD
ncbi:MAG TPA: ABC transporter permease [Vicinamibacteria bacterium]|nr:ABC transporter permease [Vicinamibacteria bacterium]